MKSSVTWEETTYKRLGVYGIFDYFRKYKNQTKISGVVIDMILERGAPLLCGCVGQNLDKEAKFDSNDKDKKKWSIEARGLRSLAPKKCLLPIKIL